MVQGDGGEVRGGSTKTNDIRKCHKETDTG